MGIVCCKILRKMVSRKPETTEWEDIQRRMGNLPELEPYIVDLPEAVFEDFVTAEATKRNAWDRASIDEIEEAHDNAMEDDDERELAEIRRRRMKELRQKHAKEIFGECRTITRSEYISEVTEASKEHKVIVLIYQEGDKKGQIVEDLYVPLARKSRSTKFLVMQENKRIAPMIICYENGDIASSFNPDVSKIKQTIELEWTMYSKRMIETDLQEDPRLHSGSNRVTINIHRKERAGYNE